MNTSFKTLAIAGLVSAFALPALAQTAGDVSTMTCGDFMCKRFAGALRGEA